MALKRVQLVRHDASGSATFTGKIGEITVNTTANSLIVHDSVTVGGFEQARSDLNNVGSATVLVAGKMTPVHVAQLNAATSDINTAEATIITNTNNIASNAASIAVNIANILANSNAIVANNILIVALENGKATKAVSIVDGNLVTMNALGDLVDTGETLADVHDASQLTGTLPSVVLPQASESAPGAIQLSTPAEVTAKTNTEKALTPSDISTLMSTPGPIGNATAASGSFTTLAVSSAATFNHNFTSRGITDRGNVGSPSIYIASNGNVSVGNGVNATRRFNVEDSVDTYIQVYATGVTPNAAGIVFRNFLNTWFVDVLDTGGFSIASSTADVLTFTISGRLDVANSRVVLDEDDMSSDSADQLATQQSIKAYVDGKVLSAMPAVVAGITNRVFESEAASRTSSGPMAGTKYHILRSGTYTFTYRFRNQGATGNVDMRLYVNETTAYAGYVPTSVNSNETSGSEKTYTSTLVLVAGDIVRLHADLFNSSAGADLVYFYISTANPLFE